MEHITSIINSLDGDQTVKSVALVTGFIHVTDIKNLLERPINTALNGILYGSIYAMGARLVSDSLPENGKKIFAGLILASGIYYMGKKLFKRPSRSNILIMDLINE